jgi:ABC-type polysaccharide transport system permease subunit
MVMDYLFDWMIVVNFIVAILNIEKQVLTNLKSVTGVEKIFFFDRNYVSISGKCIPLDSDSGNPPVCDEE